MKLYFVPGACSLAPHIVMREAGLPFDIDKVDPATKKTAGGEDFMKANPKGYVPALRLADGNVLTEAGVLVQYLADQKPESGLAPKPGTLERYRMMEWINFIATEIHKGYGPLWNPQTSEAGREAAKAQLAKRFAVLEAHFAQHPFLMGDSFSAADAYLFTVLNWSGMVKVDLSKTPKMAEYVARVASRPKVLEALKAEGLIS
ncbi:glutathione transferase GstA [Myxococcaceae bacterium GXIMD 01537]